MFTNQRKFQTIRRSVSKSLFTVAMSTLSLATLTATATAGDFVDTRLSFVFSDDNLLSGPGESLVNSPQPDFGPRGGLFLPFESLNSKDSMDSTLTNLVLYKEMPGFVQNLTTDAALVARLDILTNPQTGFRAGDIRLSDGGSYLRARYAIGDAPEVDEKSKLTKDSRRQFEVTFFPVNADRFRAGYTYDLSFAGNNIYTDRKSAFATPGMRIRFDWDGFYILAGAKSTRQLILKEDRRDVENRELGAFWGGIAGLGYVHDYFAIETNGAFFDAGRMPKQGVQGKKLYSAGVAARISGYTKGFKPETSIDYRLYRVNDDAFAQSNFFLRKPKTYDSFAGRVSVEGNWVTQTLSDYDKVGSTKRINGYSAALRSDFYVGNLAVNIDVVYRDLYTILFNVPGLDPYTTFPKDSEQTPEILAAVKGEYWFPTTNLLPSFVFGIHKPATYRGRVSETGNPSSLGAGKQTVVIPTAGQIIAFPSGQEAKEVYSLRGSLRWDLSDMMSLIGEVTYSYDRNQLGRQKDDTNYTASYFMRDPHVVGISAFAQAKF